MKLSPLIKQTWTSSAVWWNMIGMGMSLSYTTSLLPALQHPESPIKAGLNTISWLSSSYGISGIPGFLISSYLMEVYGRKLAHFVLILPAMVGWICIYLGQNISTLMIGRILGGMSTGATVTLGAIAIGEYSDPVYRGVFLNLKTATIYVGGMLAHILGHYLEWRTVALLAVIPHIFAVFITFTWPESPSWLAARGEFELCKTSFFWLRDESEEPYKELNELIKVQKNVLSKPKVKISNTESIKEFFKKFQRKDFFKPVFIVTISITLMEASGRHYFGAYALQIISEVSNNKSQSFYFTLAIDVIIIICALVSAILIKIMKRRSLLFSTGIASFIVLMIISAYLTWGVDKNNLTNQSWIGLALIVLYFVLANLGCSPIPMALLGEVFPLSHRGAGSAVAGIIMSVYLMLVLQITPHLLFHIGVHGMFFVYGLIMGGSLLMLYFFLPETKDRTLQEIENEFYGKYNGDVESE